jgi:hypothetical protein
VGERPAAADARAPAAALRGPEQGPGRARVRLAVWWVATALGAVGSWARAVVLVLVGCSSSRRRSASTLARLAVLTPRCGPSPANPMDRTCWARSPSGWSATGRMCCWRPSTARSEFLPPGYRASSQAGSAQRPLGGPGRNCGQGGLDQRLAPPPSSANRPPAPPPRSWPSSPGCWCRLVISWASLALQLLAAGLAQPGRLVVGDALIGGPWS